MEVESGSVSEGRARSKTSLRLKYEAEIAVLKRELGSLEDIRIKLGFSRRKICQILMVDPSAWTRWTSEEADAPPHVYQALKWYLDSKTHQMNKFEGLWDEMKRENRSLYEDLLSVKLQLRRHRIFFYSILVLMMFFAGLSSALLWFHRL